MNGPVGAFQKGYIVDDRYEIIERIGSGGFSEVYRARHVQIGRSVALKIMSKELIDADSSYLERFRREAKIGAELTHANAVTIYDFGEIQETGQAYIAMEFLEGHELADELRNRGPLSPNRAFRLLRPVLDALNEGHQLGIVHRDLKPENLFLIRPGGMNELLKIVDFGIAGLIGSKAARLTMSRRILGTPRFMAPEYIKTQAISPTIDVYQMALIFSEVISGEPAVKDNSMASLMRHCEGNINICNFLKIGPVGEVFKRAFCVDPGMRYQNCGEFGRALDGVESYFNSGKSLGTMKTVILPETAEELAKQVKAAETRPAKRSDPGGIRVNGSYEAIPHNPSGRRNGRRIDVIVACILGVLVCLAAGYFFGAFDGLKTSLLAAPAPVAPAPVAPASSPEELLRLEQLYVDLLHFPKAGQISTSSAIQSDDEKEKVALEYVLNHVSREYRKGALELLDSVKEHRNRDAEYFHGALGLWDLASRGVSEHSEYEKYRDYIYSAAMKGNIDAIIYCVQNEGMFKPELKAASALYISEHEDEILNGDDPRKLMKLATAAVRARISDPDENRAFVDAVMQLLRKGASASHHHAELGLILLEEQGDDELIFQRIREISQNDVAEANWILADLYMHAITDRMLHSSGMPVSMFNRLTDKVRKSIQGLDAYDQLRLVIGYMSRSGGLSLDVYGFYQNCGMKNAELAGAVLESMFRQARDDEATRSRCDDIAERLGIDFEAESPSISFEPGYDALIWNSLTECYRNAFETGHDYPERLRQEDSRSSAWILSRIYGRGAVCGDKAAECRDNRYGAMIAGARAGDGSLAGELAMSYRNGVVLPKDEGRMYEWAEAAKKSRYCESCRLRGGMGKECDVCFECAQLLKNRAQK